MLQRVWASGFGRPAAALSGLGSLSSLSFRQFSTEGPPQPANAATDRAEAAGMAAAAEAADNPAAGGGIPHDVGAAAGAAAGASATSSSSHDQGSYQSYLPKVVVFGGNGFVGSHACQQALNMGAEVVSVNRSGRPRSAQGGWVDQVHWVQGDALDPQQPWKEALRGASGVVSTLGAFGSNELMYRICGEANMRVMDAAADAGVPRFSFISVADFKLPAGWHSQDFLLKGYFRGKRDAEQHMAAVYPTGGVALRPSFIYGTRHVGSMNVHLGLIGAPLKAALTLLPTKTLANIPILGAAFIPPASVDAVGKAAVSAVLDPSVPPGIMDVWTIIEKYS